ncbi:unnamed protein product [Discula destructiva]
MLGSRAIGIATLIFNITDTNLENSAIRPDGSLLITTADAGELLSLDPTAAYPKADVVATFNGATILGISPIGYDQYAVVGSSAVVNGSTADQSVWTVDLRAKSSCTPGLKRNGTAQPKLAAVVPVGQNLNGVAALPANPHVVLVSDALAGVVYRVDTDTGAYSVAANDTAFDGAGNYGVNGIKILDGHVYFVNFGVAHFGRWAIAEDGSQAGDVEIIATEASADDFVLAADGTAYLANQTEPYNVYQVSLDGSKEFVADSDSNGRPCSLALAKDGVTGYYTTATGEVFKWEVPS